MATNTPVAWTTFELRMLARKFHNLVRGNVSNISYEASVHKDLLRVDSVKPISHHLGQGNKLCA